LRLAAGGSFIVKSANLALEIIRLSGVFKQMSFIFGEADGLAQIAVELRTLLAIVCSSVMF
jgi:hypothetical protein